MSHLSIIRKIITAQTSGRREVEDLDWSIETPFEIDGREPDHLRGHCTHTQTTFQIHEKKGRAQLRWHEYEGPVSRDFDTIGEAKAAANGVRRDKLGLITDEEIRKLPPVLISGWEERLSPEERAELGEGLLSKLTKAPEQDPDVVWQTAKGQNLTFADIDDRHLGNIINMITARRDEAERRSEAAKGVSVLIFKEKRDDWDRKLAIFTEETGRRADLTGPEM